MRVDPLGRLPGSFIYLARPSFLIWALLFSACSSVTASSLHLTPAGSQYALAAAQSGNSDDICVADQKGSPFIPVDSWIYPSLLRLHSLGFLDHVFLDLRPWTRASIGNMLRNVNEKLETEPSDRRNANYEEARKIFDALKYELNFDSKNDCIIDDSNGQIESTYSAVRAISGTSLHDSYHLGSTIVNDYDRPYAHGINNYSGVSGYASRGRFLLYARAELQASGSSAGYLNALAQELSNLDAINFINPSTGLPYYQATIPMGPIAAAGKLRLLEAYASVDMHNHIVSFGKQDEWLGPAQGGSMAYSNNAANLYAFHINRIEPLRVPGLSSVTGPFRYEFLVGPLHGHTEIAPTATTWVNPGTPWVHVEKISFRPTANLEMGFERTVIWGGRGHEPVTLHTFLRSFFSVTAPSKVGEKNGPLDPGARFGAFDFTYRIPYARNWLTLYTDSEVHDDVSPIDAPRRASIRPGLYLSHVPGMSKLDVRVEAASTDPSISNSHFGNFMYYEAIQRQGYTNEGALFGDWIGREDKGGQAWITYHLSGNEWISLGMRNQKAAKDFIQIVAAPATSTTAPVPGTELGTTLNDVNIQVVKRLSRDIELNGQFTLERWKAPVYLSGQQTVTSTTIQLTWFPKHRLQF